MDMENLCGMMEECTKANMFMVGKKAMDNIHILMVKYMKENGNKVNSMDKAS